MYSRDAGIYSKGGLKVGRKIGVGKAGVSQNARVGGRAIEPYRNIPCATLCLE